MKKILITLAIAAISLTVNAQEHKTEVGKALDSTGVAIKKGANAVAEVSVKGGATLLDQRLKGKVGPYGKTVYRDGKDRIYYVNKKGGKVYIYKSQLRKKK
jgi:hypothetical protein